MTNYSSNKSKSYLAVFAFALALSLLAVASCTTEQINENDAGDVKQLIATAEDCAGMSEDKAASCYSYNAVKNKDFSLCHKIAGETNEQMKISCYTDVASNIMDPTLCDGMQLQYQESYQVTLAVENCKTVVNTVKTKSGETAKPSTGGVNTVESCKDLSDQTTTMAASCYLRAAVGAKDWKVCENINGDTISQIRIQCFNEVSAAMNDQAVCNNLNVPNYKYTDMAIQQCKRFVETKNK